MKGQNMKYNTLRKLGKFGAKVAPIGIGAMSFTNFYGPCNDAQANDVLIAAFVAILNKSFAKFPCFNKNSPILSSDFPAP